MCLIILLLILNHIYSNSRKKKRKKQTLLPDMWAWLMTQVRFIVLPVFTYSGPKMVALDSESKRNKGLLP